MKFSEAQIELQENLEKESIHPTEKISVDIIRNLQKEAMHDG